MFSPFESPNAFFPGLIVWCEPAYYELDHSAPAHERRKPSRELRPGLVVSVDYKNRTFEVARLCADTPKVDPQHWVRIDSPPPITWKINNAWIRVAPPPTVAMVFHDAKVMHPNRDVYYSIGPVASTNLQNYWIHRNNYENSKPRKHQSACANRPSNSIYIQSTSSTISAAAYPIQAPFANRSPQKYNQEALPPSATSTATHVQGANVGGASSSHERSHAGRRQRGAPAAYSSLAPQPVVVPPGFTETDPRAPGWLHNPVSGWFWHADHGLLPPSTNVFSLELRALITASFSRS